MAIESLSPQFIQAIERGAVKALTTVKVNYEQSLEPLNNYTYHTTRHALDVARRAVAILATIRLADPSLVSERDLYITYLTGMFHDSIQKWSREVESENGFNIVTRKRRSPQNEVDSADFELEFMRGVNRQRTQTIFTAHDFQEVREGILATVPEFLPNEKTVFQPYLTPSSSYITRAIALSDINGVLIDGSGTALRDTDTLFLERNLDILEAVKDPDSINDEMLDSYKKRIINWTASQTSFVQGRQRLLMQEISFFPGHVQDVVRTKFSYGNQSIVALEKLHAKRCNQSSRDLIKELYNIKI